MSAHEGLEFLSPPSLYTYTRTSQGGLKTSTLWFTFFYWKTGSTRSMGVCREMIHRESDREQSPTDVRHSGQQVECDAESAVELDGAVVVLLP